MDHEHGWGPTAAGRGRWDGGMVRRAAIATAAVAASLAWGCDKLGGGGAPAGSATATAVAETGATAKAATETPKSTGAAADAPVAPVKAAGRSPVPTLAEWNGQPKEVTVKGSSALGCETKMVREYLRVSCRGKNDSGGTPTTVKITKGGRGEALTFASGGVTSLILPFVAGTDFEADFSWTDKSHTFVAAWPRGSNQPVVVGEFKGAKSPLNGGDGGLEAKLCECHKKVTKEKSCENMLSGPNADCERTYGSDCANLLACSRGEPGALPKCPAGTLTMSPANRCYAVCGPGKPPCKANEECTKDMLAQPVCVEK